MILQGVFADVLRRTVWLVAWRSSAQFCGPLGCLSVPIPGWLQGSTVPVPYHLQEKLHSFTVEILLLFVSDIPSS